MSSKLRSLLPALFGGMLWGLCDASRILLHERLFLTGSDPLWLLGAGAAGAMALALPGGVLAGLSGLRPALRVRALWAGLLVPTLGAIAVRWFSDPPPFQAPFFLQGNPLAFGGIALGLLGAAWGVGRLPGAAQAALLVAALGLRAGLPSGGTAAEAQAQGQAAPQGDRPDVLLVTLDTTRYDRFGANGNARVDTRHFDALAAAGARFTAAAAVAPVTGPSHASMLSGAGPWDHGVLLNGVPLPADRPMLAELLKERGYATAAFVSAYVLDGELGFSRGFDVYDDDFGWLRGSDGLLMARLLAMSARHSAPDTVLERRGGDTADLALGWLRAHQRTDQPWFAWVHLFDAHGPYDPPPPYDTRYYQGDPYDPAHTSMQQVSDVAPYLKQSLKGVTDLDYVLARYDGEISYADSQLGRLLEAIPADTVVIVIGDHGESLGEHGVWFNHGDDLYETSVHVPLAVRWAGHIAPATVQTPFEGSDLAPTVLGLLGIAAPPAMTGQSAAPLLLPADLTTGAPPPRAMAAAMCFDRVANLEERKAGRITAPRWRMSSLRGPGSRYLLRELTGDASYFDLNADPTGLTDARADLLATPDGAALDGILNAQAAALFGSTATGRSAAETTDEVRQRLEALGYLDQ